MELRKRDLVEMLRVRPKKDFPGGVGYYNRYVEVSEFLEREVHPHVPVGAALADGNFLNDHGPVHIKTVVHRASELVEFERCELTSYEIYILLAAIQIHDVGNILGRLDHEKKPRELNQTLDVKLGPDSMEKRLIFDIGEAHGGDLNGDKDTIGKLPDHANILNHRVRPQYLAAILRLADELADDRTRAARFPLERGIIPDHCVIYHKYSEALHSVMIDHKGGEVQLEFELTVADTVSTFRKDSRQQFLIEEIMNRTRKLHFERVYCMRFLRPDITLNRATVTVKVYRERYGKPIEEVGWRLEEKGYPDDRQTIYDICPELQFWRNGLRLTGETLKDAVEARTEGANPNGNI